MHDFDTVWSTKAMEAANMVEVDPKLFVTCRLCLEEMGVYQIVPAIQQQIKYCFDIDVDPFDGLPQLLCKTCESLLCDYYKTKKSFSEKQKSLILMKQDLKTVPLAYPQLDTVSSSQLTNGDHNAITYHKEIKRIKRKRIISTTSDSDSSASTEITKAQVPSVTDFNRSKLTSWESGYNKLFVCKLCNGYFRRKTAVLSHLRSHRLLMSKYQSILKTYCTVELTKLDYKPNLTGDINKVVHSFHKITQEGDSYYYVIYVPKETFDGALMDTSELISSCRPFLKTRDYSSVHEGKKDKRKSSTISSDDESSIEPKRRMSRLISACSNETVVIGNKKHKSDLENDDLKIKTFFGANKEEHNYIDCIDIEDSSDNSSNKSNSGSKQEKVSREPIKVKPQECKAIHNIISLCHKKYMKRKETSESNTQNKKPNKDYLKHKVLSIGRKIVTKTGFNCNGLLRYMESKNLELVWLPRSQQNASLTSYIQINAKLRSNKENVNDFNKSEWTTITQTPQDNEVEQEDTEAGAQPSSLTVDNDTRQADITLPSSVVTIQCKGSEPIQTDCAVLYAEPSNAESKSILLNENPVANPKHFPNKKGNLITSKHNMSNSIYDEIPNIADVIENDDSSLCLPIITSTKSLAIMESTEQTQQSVEKNISNTQLSSENNIAQQKPGPRIKVKPVTELLSERILHSIMNSQTNQMTIPCSTSQIQNISQPLQEVENSSSLNTSVRIAHEPTTGLREYIILDTVEFPNTKTDSPFRYFKNLLQLHNIVLLDTDYSLPRDFTCLIKFKVLYKQETKDHPVILCLSLFCSKNAFCLKVKDRNQENINMSKISANWQWELLKVYKGDVVNKLLQNALKVSQEMYEHTKTFLCLLESINYKTDN